MGLILRGFDAEIGVQILTGIIDAFNGDVIGGDDKGDCSAALEAPDTKPKTRSPG